MTRQERIDEAYSKAVQEVGLSSSFNDVQQDALRCILSYLKEAIDQAAKDGEEE